MSWNPEIVTEPTARKEYLCRAFEWLDCMGVHPDDVEPEEWALIEKARKDGGKILPGMKYIKVTGKWDGEWSTFRARPELNAICHKYDIYQE